MISIIIFCLSCLKAEIDTQSEFISDITCERKAGLENHHIKVCQK